MNLWIFALVALCNVPLLFLVAKVLFRNWRGFWDAMEALFVLDLSSALSGEDHYKPGKFELALWIVFACLSTLAEYYLAARFIWGMADPWNG